MKLFVFWLGLIFQPNFVSIYSVFFSLGLFISFKSNFSNWLRIYCNGNRFVRVTQLRDCYFQDYYNILLCLKWFLSILFLNKHVILTTRSLLYLPRNARRNNNKTDYKLNIEWLPELSLFLSSLRLYTKHTLDIYAIEILKFSLQYEFNKKVELILNFNLWSSLLKT